MNEKTSWYIHTIEYYSAIRRNKIQIHAIMQMNLENTMLSQRSQIQKITYYYFYIKYPEQVNQIADCRMQISDCQGLQRREKGKQLLNEYRLSFWR